MEQIKRLKVVIICNFSTPEVRKHLQLDSRQLYNLIRRLFRMPVSRRGFGDVAPWTANTIKHLSERDDIDLHVISGHSGLKKMHTEFQIKNVHYHFVKVEYTTLLKIIIRSDELWRKLNPLRPLVKKIVYKIKPDIVNLIGAENAFMASTALDITEYPVYVLCQTIYNNPDRGKYGGVDTKNASTERLIFKSMKYFGVYSEMHYLLLKNLTVSPYIFEFKWPSVPLPEIKEVNVKRFDFVNFAVSMSFNKGFHDSIKALAIVKKKYPHVRLNLVGGADTDIKKELEKLIEELSVQDNVHFTDFFEHQIDMFQHLQYSRFALLPCKVDNIAGTMLQAMHYGLPLIVYKTPGTPLLNRDQENILIAEHSSIESLSEKMLYLLENPEVERRLHRNAQQYMRKENDNRSVVDDFVKNYRLILDHFVENRPIPQEALFKQNL